MAQKQALITGASRGIGRAIALTLSRDGYRILLHYAGNETAAKQTAADIISQGGSVKLLKADLSDLTQTKDLSNTIKDVDVLVLNASVQIRAPWQQITEPDAQTQLNCNFLSSLLLIQAVTDHMKGKHWGRIITVGSVQETKPHPDMLIYSASKAAQSNMVRSLALQLAPDGITVNNICPGVIATDRNKEALSDESYAQKVLDSIPAGFYGQPEDCAGIVSLLCSDAGRYITGQSIYVDGGKCM